MQPRHFNEQLQQAVDRPRCPECGARMWLMCIESEKTGRDLRTFTCPVCEYSETVMVKYR